MSITEWSDSIVIAELNDEPSFSEDMDALLDRLDEAPQTDHMPDVVLNLHEVTFLNSSNLAQLLRLRKKLMLHDRRLLICCVNDSVWSVMLTTGLDTVFSFAKDVSTSLASLQIQ